VSNALDQAEKESYLLVLFTYGDPSDPDFAYYTNWSQDQGPYVGTPALKVTIPKNTGVMQNDPATIELPSDTFTDRLTNGEPHSEVTVQVEEITRGLDGGPAASRLLLFTGTVVSSMKSTKGRSGNRVLKVQIEKNFLDVPLGVPTEHHCVFVFNGFGCDSGTVSGGSPVGPILVSPTVATIDGKVLTTTSPPTAPNPTHYRRGFFRREGVIVEIRDFDASVSGITFYCTRRPPADWVGQQVELIAGCTGEIGRCREWDNEQNFGGWGSAIPAYNPAFEDSP
jgi:hypothetical protein